tara:strand:- start:29428 stop:32046 length:2619 start_codon:yes stop_codon:yes gene_type:complete
VARTDYSGKRGSNAGDEYHELWAARRALELITPGTDLVELTVEGVRADDAEGLDEALWDGVDAAFYYGPDVDTIEGVDLVQFKYSGSDPDTPWTVARLAYAKNKAKTNALIARLASAWKGMRKQRRELDAADKIVVKLASNQPLAQEVLDALVAAPGDAMRTKLQKASGLTLAEFAAFAPALDFSDCGNQSRFAHEERVIQTLSGLADGDVRAEFAVLREFIRKRMRPEGSRETITAESVFGIFGHADKRIFYPCPTEIARVSELVPRAAAGAIETLFAQGTQKICLAGAGGEGKTTVLQDLAQRLPTGSELIVYDCYGGGTYLNSNSYRHRAEDAFLQLANDTAARLLLPPLFSETGVDHPRRFARKLDATAAALASRHPDALLVIAVDAADNAVTAASQCVPPERAFVHDLARLGGVPANVRLMFSARTGRLADLELPDDVVPVPLGPFGPEESIRFAEARLGPQAEDWHEEFHFHSGGNPRVQRYAIEFAGEVADAALDYLKPNGKNLELIFTTRFEEARTKSGSTAELTRFCAALIVLPRPVPIGQLAGVLGAEPAHIRDLIADLAPGLVLADELVSFADEDFEYFLREAGASAMSAMGARAADHLMARRMADPYAASHVANLALLAGRREDVIALVREPVADYPIADPAARGEVHRRRLRAAMHGDSNKTVRDEAGGEDREETFRFLKTYTVFNVAQIDGLPERFHSVPETAPAVERIECAEAFFASIPATVNHGGDRAFYMPSADRIQLPPFAAFHDAHSYYTTRGHETVHWTRHASRLDRSFGREKWGDEGYAREELVAELGAAFLSADLGLAIEPRHDHASYLASWIKVLQNDTHAIVQAAAHAERAVAYLHQLAKSEEARAAA